MDTRTSDHGGRLVVSPSGRLDSQNAPAFEARLAADVEAGHRDLVLDLSGLDYISSSGLSALLSVAKKIRRAEGRMVLAGPRTNVMQVIAISGFERIFEVFPGVEAAIAAG